MENTFTAVYDYYDAWWTAYIEEKPDVRVKTRTFMAARALIRESFSASLNGAANGKENVIQADEVETPFGRIALRHDVFYGQACVKGHRIPVFEMVRMLANGTSVEELQEDYRLSRNQILACLDYASLIVEDQSQPSVYDEDEVPLGVTMQVVA